MESKQYEVLHYERVEDESGGTMFTTAEVLRL